MENARKDRDIKLVKTEEQRSKLVLEPNYHTKKHFTENLLGIEMKKTKVKMNKPLYLGITILDISKIFMYKFWYDYIKPKYGDRAKLCYTDTDSFIIHIFTENVFEDIGDVEDSLVHLAMMKMTNDLFQFVKKQKNVWFFQR